MCRHLQQEGRGCDYLILWLDCDREGENICFEVMDNVVPVMRKGGGARQVLRAPFSAVSAPEVQAAVVRGGGAQRAVHFGQLVQCCCWGRGRENALLEVLPGQQQHCPPW